MCNGALLQHFQDRKYHLPYLPVVLVVHKVETIASLQADFSPVPLIGNTCMDMLQMGPLAALVVSIPQWKPVLADPKFTVGPSAHWGTGSRSHTKEEGKISKLQGATNAI
jgi:hypothetical protein